MKIHLLKKLVCLFAIIFSLNAQAQQDPIFSQYLMNPLAYNPAYAGTYDLVNASLINRVTNLGGKPQQGQGATQGVYNGIAINSSFPSTDVMGLGLYVINSKYGIYKNLDATLAYSYKIKINDYTRLSFGLQSTYTSHGYNYNLNFTQDQLSQSDPLYNVNQPNISTLNFGGGLYLLNQEKFFASFSVPKILPTTYQRNGVTLDKYNPTIFISGGVILGSKGNLPVRPSFLLRTSKGAPTSLDLSTSVLLSKIIWVGVTVRSFNTAALLVQLDLSEHFRIGYSVDSRLVYNSKTATGGYGTHELTLNVNFAAFKKQTVIPRFF